MRASNRVNRTTRVNNTVRVTNRMAYKISTNRTYRVIDKVLMVTSS